MGKHEGDEKKHKPYIPPKPKGGDTLGGGDGKHSGKGDDNGGKK